MYSLLRPILFKLPPETAHALSLKVLDYLPQQLFKKPRQNIQRFLGLEFPHVVGLAAGLDKDAKHLRGLAKLGFSFIEVGTVTPKPQIGNPKPRLFRIPAAHALINRMGFNNLGVDALCTELKNSQYRGILGVNIGKNKDTPLDKAVDDYLYCFKKVQPYASYVAVNISSPNTPGLRQLQQLGYLQELLGKLREEQLQLADRRLKYVPLLVKLSPDEPDDNLVRIAETIENLGLDGIIISNTTSDKSSIQAEKFANEAGGLSGPPLAKRSTHCLRLIRQSVSDKICLIGVGGIDSKEQAQEKLKAGANLLQLYTGLIYQGPKLIHQITDLVC